MALEPGRPSLMIGRPGRSRRQFLTMLSAVAPVTLRPLPARGQDRSQSESARQPAPTSYTLQLNGAKIQYRQWGAESALPMLLLHPGLLNSHVWDQFAPAMASRWRVIAPDARGMGDSEWNESYDPDTYNSDLHALITELKLARVVLCGNSMGGSLAFMYAGQYPQNVERLILVDTGPGDRRLEQAPAPTPTVPRRGPPPIPAGPFSGAADAAAQIPKAYGPAFTRAMIDHNLKRHADGSWRWKHDPKVMTAYERSINDPRKWPLWKAVQCPTLVLRGEQSPALSQHAAEQMVAENKHATLVVIPGAGHFIPLEAPAAFEAAVRKWLGA